MGGSGVSSELSQRKARPLGGYRVQGVGGSPLALVAPSGSRQPGDTETPPCWGAVPRELCRGHTAWLGSGTPAPSADTHHSNAPHHACEGHHVPSLGGRG